MGSRSEVVEGASGRGSFSWMGSTVVDFRSEQGL